MAGTGSEILEIRHARVTAASIARLTPSTIARISLPHDALTPSCGAFAPGFGARSSRSASNARPNAGGTQADRDRIRADDARKGTKPAPDDGHFGGFAPRRPTAELRSDFGGLAPNRHFSSI